MNRKNDRSWIYDNDYGADESSPFADIFCLLVLVMLVVAVPSGSMKDTGLSIAAGGECDYVNGNIVDKTTDNGYWDLYVVSNIGNYIISVSEETYNSVEIGDSYGGQVCNGDGPLWDLVLWLIAHPGEADNITIGDFWSISNS